MIRLLTCRVPDILELKLLLQGLDTRTDSMLGAEHISVMYSLLYGM